MDSGGSAGSSAGLGWDDIGFIAEEVAEVDPRLVEFNDSDEPESVAYDRLVVHLVNVCQQLQDRVAALEAQ